MTEQHAKETWQAILLLLDEKMQYGFLEQAKSVVDVRINGSEISLAVSNDEALRFFSAEVNQQRLIIVSRSVISFEKVTVHKVEAEPLR